MPLIRNDLAGFFWLTNLPLPEGRMGLGGTGISGPRRERPNCILTFDTMTPGGPILGPVGRYPGPETHGHRSPGPRPAAQSDRNRAARHRSGARGLKSAPDGIASSRAPLRWIGALPASGPPRGKLGSKIQISGIAGRPGKRPKIHKITKKRAGNCLISPKTALTQAIGV